MMLPALIMIINSKEFKRKKLPFSEPDVLTVLTGTCSRIVMWFGCLETNNKSCAWRVRLCYGKNYSTFIAILALAGKDVSGMPNFCESYLLKSLFLPNLLPI